MTTEQFALTQIALTLKTDKRIVEYNCERSRMRFTMVIHPTDHFPTPERHQPQAPATKPDPIKPLEEPITG